MGELEFTLRPVKGLEDWIKKQYETHYIWYRRKGYYAECVCSECGQKYILRTVSTGDPFEDDAVDIEKPERDKETKCRRCGTKAEYKPAGHTKSEYHYKYFVSGQKITDDKFVFRIYDTRQVIHANLQTGYRCYDYKLIVCEKGKKPVRYDWNHTFGWLKTTCGEQFAYTVHPSTFREIKKTGMYKYVPFPDYVHPRSMLIDFYIAAARYPDFEMMIKVGLDDIWQRLTMKMAVNLNPRGRNIEDRLRIYKSRLKPLIEAKGQHEKLFLYQLEKRTGAHWTDEDIEIIETLRNECFGDKWQIALKYATPTRLKNYMVKQKIWPKNGNMLIKDYTERRKRSEVRSTYYDYLQIKADQGYEMNDIQVFPKDIRRRHDEMVLEAEKTKLDKRKKEANERYSKIKAKYRRLSDKYSAAAGGLIIRPAKDAAEIVTEGRILHHCVGGDNYLSSHNDGRSFILFLRKISEKDTPYITVEIRDDQIIQWYGAYDRKPDKQMIEAWLEKYIKELKKHEKMLKKSKKSPKTKQNVQKTA